MCERNNSQILGKVTVKSQILLTLPLVRASLIEEIIRRLNADCNGHHILLFLAGIKPTIKGARSSRGYRKIQSHQIARTFINISCRPYQAEHYVEFALDKPKELAARFAINRHSNNTIRFSRPFGQRPAKAKASIFMKQSSKQLSLNFESKGTSYLILFIKDDSQDNSKMLPPASPPEPSGTHRPTQDP